MWGSNSFGQLGLTDKRGKNPVPVQLPKEVCVIIFYKINIFEWIMINPVV